MARDTPRCSHTAEQCKVDTDYRYKECEPMDRQYFDCDRRLILGADQVTIPTKKRLKRDSDYFTPEQYWRPSLSSLKLRKNEQGLEAARKYLRRKIDAVDMTNFTVQVPNWLYQSLVGALSSSKQDLHIAFETSLEIATMSKIDQVAQERTKVAEFSVFLTLGDC